MMGVLAVVLSAGFGAATAVAGVIYSDTFARGSSGTPLGLNGTQLNVASGFTGSGGYGGSTTAQWAANGGVTTDGAQAHWYGAEEAYLPFTPQSGCVYTYSLALNALGTDANWAAFGFANVNFSNPTTSGNWHEVNAPGPWMLMRGDRTSDDQIFAGPGTTGGESLTGTSANSAAGYNTLSWVLDTTGANWTAQFYRGATATGSLFTYATPPTINAVGFGSADAPTSVKNLSLSVNVPEPSTIALLGTGLLGLLARRRRRACRPAT